MTKVKLLLCTSFFGESGRLGVGTSRGWVLITFSYLQGGRLFQVGAYYLFLPSGWAFIPGGCLLPFPTFRVGAYSRWVLI